MSIRQHIPNALTSSNLLCGVFAVLAVVQGNATDAFLLVCLGALFDFFDGFAARLLGVSSPVGKELDSLADVVTFGVVPAVMASQLTLFFLSKGSWTLPEFVLIVLTYAGLLIAAFSALRLAKFNLDTRQSDSFIGLPPPANAMFWGGLFVSRPLLEHLLFACSIPATAVVVVLLLMIALSCWIMVAEVPMFALKFKHFRPEGDNLLRYGFVLAALLLSLGGFLAGFDGLGLSAAIVLYVVISLFTQRAKPANHDDQLVFPEVK